MINLKRAKFQHLTALHVHTEHVVEQRVCFSEDPFYTRVSHTLLAKNFWTLKSRTFIFRLSRFGQISEDKYRHLTLL